MLAIHLSTLALGGVAGLVATFVMDASGFAGRRFGLTRGLDPRFMGRWLAGIPRGRLVHANIALSEPLPTEFPVSVVAHLSIGVVLGVVFAVLASVFPPSGAMGVLGLGVTYGMATNVFPWMLMFPAMGFGLAGRSGPADAWLLRSSAWVHTFYGLGLGLAWLVLGR